MTIGMTPRVAAVVALSLLAGCGGESKKARQAAQEAAAANYTPPSVTSRVDYGAMIDRRFRRLDHNGDDRLTPDEFPRPDAARYAGLDRNHDGAVTQQEYSEGMLARFDTQDVNHDGSVTSDERELARGRR